MSYFRRVLAPGWQTVQHSTLSNESVASMAKEHCHSSSAFLEGIFFLPLPPPPRLSLLFFFSFLWIWLFNSSSYFSSWLLCLQQFTFLHSICQVTRVTEDRTLIISLGVPECSRRQTRHLEINRYLSWLQRKGKAAKASSRACPWNAGDVLFKNTCDKIL